MLVVFNAFQMVCLFAAGPFILSYLHGASWSGAGVAFWVGCVAYLVGFFGMTAAVTVALDSTK